MKRTILSALAGVLTGAAAIGVGLAVQPPAPAPAMQVDPLASSGDTSDDGTDPDDPPMNESSAETMATEIAEQYPDFDRRRVGGLGRGDGQQAAFSSPDGDRWVTATLSYAPGMTLEDIRAVATHDGALESELDGDVLTVFNAGGDTSVIRQPSEDTHVVVIVTAAPPGDGLTAQSTDGSQTDEEAETLAADITAALRTS